MYLQSLDLKDTGIHPYPEATNSIREQQADSWPWSHMLSSTSDKALILGRLLNPHSISAEFRFRHATHS